ncbi:FAD-dependent oxidoreductase [Miniphocaeibacter halophilus]|uniref:FAD-dependent oxidoreductase n=1 Tax=Miniphocaeibacter halophilus TaxID=2931922 RepID=A0AC61N7Q0_9FIRM|nr:FAD-dependent oxidoreductase [Miniphocaeibacter halophilus]QQK08243.1 FAD-dependent oxidoreductase [Miniphocaeibacter halophilus]
MKRIKAEIISIENTNEDYYSIKLKPLDEFSWKAGQFVIVKMPESKINGKDKRTLSIASAPEEGFIMLGTRTGENISNFKRELLSKKPGDIITIEGPMGMFVKKEEMCPMVLVAGGIGITPVRGLLKSLEDEIGNMMELVYSSKNYYMYLDDLKEISEKNNRLILHTTENRVETSKEIDRIIEKYGNEPYYYISGTMGMVQSIKDKLKENNIEKTRVIADTMIGY